MLVYSSVSPLITKKVLPFAQVDFRRDQRLFGIKLEDRFSHFYILGRTGVGKSTLMKKLALNDAIQGNGLLLIDVHGDLATEVLASLPIERKSDLVVLNASDPFGTFGYNPFYNCPEPLQGLVTAGILEIFERLWGAGAWGPKLAHILRNLIQTVLATGSGNMHDLLRLLHEESFRDRCLGFVKSSYVVDFWNKEFSKYTKSDLIPIYNKLGAVLSYPQVRKVLCENPHNSLRKMMDEGKIIIVNLAKGQIGAEASYLLGSVLLSGLSSAVFSRDALPHDKRRPFFIYLDEFHHYSNYSVVEMLSEWRKYRVGAIMANQYLAQLEVNIRDALLSNVGSMALFRLSQADARLMTKELYKPLEIQDFINQWNYHFYMRLMIDGVPHPAFSAKLIK
ncbi:MAG: type IV secretion system DNA-binding domain-containing protein [Bacteroidetes bacterium]|nr:type IV secretion system DNA-binding domain-containing protein [Bacteroidota bacterium]